MSTLAPIPTILRVDVEPDEHQPTGGERPWDGFVSMMGMLRTLRQRLGAVSGHAIKPTWMIRLDPDIARAFGRPDFPVHRHPTLFDEILAERDALGVHVHPLRWDVNQQVLFADHADDAWTVQCLRSAVSTFQAAFGGTPESVSFGGYFMRNTLLDEVVTLGIKVDVTVEPGLDAREYDPSFGAYATAPSGNFTRCPRLPYYPSRTAFYLPAQSDTDARPLLMAPLTSCDYRMVLKRWYARVVRREQPRHEPLNPWKRWPSPKRFWDLAERAASELPSPYLALALRTEPRGTDMHRRVADLFDYLPRHPVAKRLRVVGPSSPAIVSLAGAAPQMTVPTESRPPAQ
jgi:hypothetical protein